MNAPEIKRIALVSTQKRWHGGESQLALLAEGLRDRGFDCLLMARRGGVFAERMRSLHFNVAEFSRCGRTPWSLWQIRQILKRFRPDVVHANDAHALTGSGAAAVGLPPVVRVASRRVDFPVHYPGRYRYFADGVLCVSKAVQSVCHAAGIERERLHIVHDGVRPSFASAGSRAAGRASLGLSDEQQLWLTVAKLTDHKGHAFLVRAIPRLLKRFPDIVFAFAGDGELRPELEAQVESLNLRSHVRFLGYRNDIPNLLAAADGIVQPSHMEGLCSSLIDAMFAEKPIVATSAGGIPDLLETESDQAPAAWLVTPESPRELAAAIAECMENPREADARGKRAKVRAMLDFTAGAMVENTLAVYQSIHAAKFKSQAASLIGKRSAA